MFVCYAAPLRCFQYYLIIIHREYVCLYVMLLLFAPRSLSGIHRSTTAQLGHFSFILSMSNRITLCSYYVKKIITSCVFFYCPKLRSYYNCLYYVGLGSITLQCN